MSAFATNVECAPGAGQSATRAAFKKMIGRIEAGPPLWSGAPSADPISTIADAAYPRVSARAMTSALAYVDDACAIESEKRILVRF
jgi:hypothetical protein